MAFVFFCFISYKLQTSFLFYSIYLFIFFKKTDLKQRANIHQSTAWPVPHACTQPYHPGSSAHHQGLWYMGLFPVHWPNGYAMLMNPNKAETAVHGCHCPCHCPLPLPVFLRADESRGKKNNSSSGRHIGIIGRGHDLSLCL